MIKEIGVKRLLKYLIFGVWDVVLRVLPWSLLRVFWLKLFGARVAWSAVVDRVNFVNLDRTGLAGLTIGRRAFLGNSAIIDLAGAVRIEAGATISPGVAIITHLSVGFSDHPLLRFYPKTVKPTVVREGSFVGTYATIFPGVTVGKRSMVGAGSVVTTSVPEGSLAFGVPAKVVKKFDFS